MWLKIFPFHVIPFQEYTFLYMKTQFFFGQKNKESLAYPKLKNLKLTLTKKSIALAKKFIQVFWVVNPNKLFGQTDTISVTHKNTWGSHWKV